MTTLIFVLVCSVILICSMVVWVVWAAFILHGKRRQKGCPHSYLYVRGPEVSCALCGKQYPPARRMQ